MSTTGKVLLTVGIMAGVAGLAWGATKVATLKRDVGNMELRLLVKPLKPTLTTMPIHIRVFVANPTETELRFMFPFVKLQYKGSTIGFSNVQHKIITLPSFTSMELTKHVNPDKKEIVTPIVIKLELLKLGELVKDLFNIVNTQKGSATIQAITQTYILLDKDDPKKKKFYEIKEDITL